MIPYLLALAAGALFAVGLILSEMINPAKVINFLDLAGDWDPTLAFVMGGGLLVTVPAYRLVLRRAKPLFAERFHLPTRKDLDARLIGGAALFGVGWGLAGLCPGPALTALSTGLPEMAGFVLAMWLGMQAARLLFR